MPPPTRTTVSDEDSVIETNRGTLLIGQRWATGQTVRALSVIQAETRREGLRSRLHKSVRDLARWSVRVGNPAGYEGTRRGGHKAGPAGPATTMLNDLLDATLPSRVTAARPASEAIENLLPVSEVRPRDAPLRSTAASKSSISSVRVTSCGITTSWPTSEPLSERLRPRRGLAGGPPARSPHSDRMRPAPPVRSIRLRVGYRCPAATAFFWLPSGRRHVGSPGRPWSGRPEELSEFGRTVFVGIVRCHQVRFLPRVELRLLAAQPTLGVGNLHAHPGTEPDQLRLDSGQSDQVKRWPGSASVLSGADREDGWNGVPPSNSARA